MEDVIIHNGVTSLGKQAFAECGNLKSITIPNTLTVMDEDAFYYCSKIERINITDMDAWCNLEIVLNRSYRPFYNDYDLYLNGELVTDLRIPEAVTYIKDYKFYGCKSITSVAIHNNVKRIGKQAFYSPNLQRVDITDITAWCNIQLDEEYYSSGANPLYCAHNLYLNGQLLTDLVIPDGIISVGDYQFFGCTSISSVTFGENTAYIGKDAFTRSGLKNITFSNNLHTIGEYAFSYCNDLTNVTIPECVNEIGNGAFEHCYNMTAVYCMSVNPPTLISRYENGSYYIQFSSQASGRKIYVPRSAADKYKLTEGWNYYADDIEGYDF